MWRSGKALDYLDIINRAVSDEKLFNSFKSQPFFVKYTGISDMAHAVQCLQKIKENPAVYANMEKFKLNDTLGRPMSKDTFRFAESVALIHNEFGDLNGKRILEFGSSYGGLSYCLLCQWSDIKRYHLIDLPPVQDLSLKYLDRLGIHWQRITADEPKEPVDLFISELSLSEQTDWLDYYNKYAKNARGLFLRTNFFDMKEFNKFLLVLREDFNLTVEPECKNARPHFNQIVIGKL